MLLGALDTVRSFLLNGVSLLMPEVFLLMVVLKLRLLDSLIDFGFELSLNHDQLLHFIICLVKHTEFCFAI